MTLTYFFRSWDPFQHENLQFSLENTTTPQILVTLGSNLYHGCISGVSWLSSRMDDFDLLFEVMGFDLNLKICNKLQIFACKYDNNKY